MSLVSQGPDEAFVEHHPSPLVAAGRSAYVGSYYSSELDAYWSVTLEADGLSLRGGYGPTFLQAFARDRFVSDAGALSFSRGGRGISGFSLDIASMRGIWFERVERRSR